MLNAFASFFMYSWLPSQSQLDFPYPVFCIFPFFCFDFPFSSFLLPWSLKRKLFLDTTVSTGLAVPPCIQLLHNVHKLANYSPPFSDNLGEDCPIFDNLFEFCQIYAGGTIGNLPLPPFSLSAAAQLNN